MRHTTDSVSSTLQLGIEVLDGAEDPSAGGGDVGKPTPYVGPLGGTLVVFVAALATFVSLWHSFLMAAAFWTTTAVEGQFVTPPILGKALKVGALVVLMAVASWSSAIPKLTWWRGNCVVGISIVNAPERSY